MQSHRLLVLFGVLLAVSCGLSGARALASTPFAIAATNVTMPSSGYGSSQYTIAGIPSAGTVTRSCLYTGPITGAKIPLYCGPVGPPSIPVEAGETLTGAVLFVPFGQIPPPGLGVLRSAPRPSGHLPAAGLALAGALMLGFSFRRRARRWLVLTVLAAGTLTGLAGIGACGGNSNAMTPGTYQYTISAAYADSVNPAQGAISTATISVTVP